MILAGNAAVDWGTRYRSSPAKTPNPLADHSAHYDQNSTVQCRPVSTQVMATAAKPDLTNPHRAQSFA
jgi:hypothetical protein